MSKHWNPRAIGAGRAAPGGRHRSRIRRRRGRQGFGAGGVRLMLLGALFVGVVYANASWQDRNGYAGSRDGEVAPADFAAYPPPDPYKESRRSREILSAQEDGPIPLDEPVGPEARTQRVGRGDVVDVIDGDTFEYGGQKIRIADIDTPEVAGQCSEETALAARATQRLAVLLAQGPFALERIGRDEDRYGRKLRVVTRGGRSIGDQLVAEGLARTWSGRREPWCA